MKQLREKIKFYSSEVQAARAITLMQAAESLLIEAADLFVTAGLDDEAQECGAISDALGKVLK